jgi:hypothetical protein
MPQPESTSSILQRFGSWLFTGGAVVLLGFFQQYNSCADRRYAEKLHSQTLEKLHGEDRRISKVGKSVDQVELDQVSR